MTRSRIQVEQLASQLKASEQSVNDLTEAQSRAMQDYSKAQSAVQSTTSELHDLRLAYSELKVRFLAIL